MNAHRFLALAAAGLVLLLGLGAGQAQERPSRLGVITARGQMSDASPVGAGLLRELAHYGYEPGRNLVLVRRSAEGRPDRLGDLVGELVAEKVDAILAQGYPAAKAAKEHAPSVPVVVMFAGDPVETGLVRSLSRPGGNVTGISDVASELTAKRLELLKEIIPSLRRVAMLWNANDLGMTMRQKAASAVADSFGVVVQPLGIREPEDFEAAFAAMTRDAPDAILMVSDALTSLNRQRVYQFAAARRLPAIYEFKYYAQDGGLLTYGPDQADSAARAGALVARILKGARPADLPVEQPTKFELAINLKTAKALGIAIPESILVRADEVIE